MILYDFHHPVLLENVIELLNIKPGKIYVDATIGGGGYSREILNRKGIVIGLDKDKDSINYLQNNLLKDAGEKNLFLFNRNFGNLNEVLKETGFEKVAGIIFDLGLSSYQLDKSKRGFSFKESSPLDMRFDISGKIKAEDIVNTYSKGQLYEIFTKNAEELNSGSIADAIVRTRSISGYIGTTLELNEIIKNAIKEKEKERINSVLARIYQAIRMEVNHEIENLKQGLFHAIDALMPGGRLVVLSYHSLEDRQVKNIFMNRAFQTLKILTKRPIRAGFNEIKLNKRARSAKLRAVEKI